MFYVFKKKNLANILFELLRHYCFNYFVILLMRNFFYEIFILIFKNIFFFIANQFLYYKLRITKFADVKDTVFLEVNLKKFA